MNFISLAVLLFSHLLGPAPSTHDPQSQQIKLLVLISVDQLRGDYLDRFRPLFQGGFKRLLDEGSVFGNCYFQYANTETGPGHATLSTGQNPRVHGIIENRWLDRATGISVYCTQDESVKPVGIQGKGSPKNLLSSSLGDWIKEADPNSKVISIAGKDRSAILLGGKKANLALWYSSADGVFGSSSYYAEKLPSWVVDWNTGRSARSHAGKKWERAHPESHYKKCGASEDDFSGEFLQVFGKRTFPYVISEEGADLNRQLVYTPYLDAMNLDLAVQAIEAEKLGQRESLDLLCLGLSALDYIGHGCGPNSQETADTLMRLDQNLGDFFRFLESKIGRDKLLIGISADHGVAPLPEWGRANKLNSRRAGEEADKALGKIDQSLRDQLGKEDWFSSSDNRALYVNRKACEARNVSVRSIGEMVSKQIQGMDFVHSAWTIEEIEKAREKDPIARSLWESIYPERSGDIFFVGVEYAYFYSGKTGTGHGTPWRYDQWVPLGFFGASIRIGNHSEVVSPVDLAPTLAELAGIPYPRSIAGVSRAGHVRQASH